jgi:hypothetical protein
LPLKLFPPFILNTDDLPFQPWHTELISAGTAIALNASDAILTKEITIASRNVKVPVALILSLMNVLSGVGREAALKNERDTSKRIDMKLLVEIRRISNNDHLRK